MSLLHALSTLLALVGVQDRTPAPIAPAPPPPPTSPYAQRVTPRGAPQTWLTDKDYPLQARRARQSGTTGFRLDVDARGRVTKCTITSSSGSAVLDATTCSLLRKRAAFNPAMGHDGKPMPATWSSRFRWQMPDSP